MSLTTEQPLGTTITSVQPTNRQALVISRKVMMPRAFGGDPTICERQSLMRSESLENHEVLWIEFLRRLMTEHEMIMDTRRWPG